MLPFILFRKNKITHHLRGWCLSPQFIHSIMSDSLWSHGLQHARLPCPLPLQELAQTQVHRVGDVIQPSHPLSSPFPLAFKLPSIRVFSKVSVFCITWPKYWSFSFSISPSNEYSGLISFRTNWFDLLAIQGTLKSFLQHHSSKAPVLWCSVQVQFSHPFTSTGKTIALSRRT